MVDPLEKAVANAPPIIGNGCTQRYDPERLGPELGTDFPDAEALWKHHQSAAELTVECTVSTVPDGD
ncbi:hypothetical protein MCB86_10665 [Pseudomonas sp. KSR10]|jgi:hypothetical protein|uniref:Uncharacterized protein n=1 Tax=Stutzerimonas stutzeri TaxID=316 RepID=A0A0D9ARQ7_STUST|nr:MULTISPECIES: hypothetical protein [Pseudomonadaceae]KJH83437.1 hypothetical protein UF78_05090 [Stutzerimonas stutzeri]MCG6540533.1 hypothetical protein [Pseudomonas sp. KSR10]